MSSSASSELEDGELPPEPGQKQSAPSTSSGDGSDHSSRLQSSGRKASYDRLAESKAATPSGYSHTPPYPLAKRRHASSNDLGQQAWTTGPTTLRQQPAPQWQVPELVASIKHAAAHVDVKDGFRSPGDLCQNLWTALRSCVELSKLLSQTDGMARTADEQPLLGELSPLLHNGLHSLHVVSGIGAGKQAVNSHSRAPDVLRLAMKYRQTLLTTAQRRDLEKWVAKSKVFASWLPSDFESHPANGISSSVAHPELQLPSGEPEEQEEGQIDTSTLSRKRQRLDISNSSVLPSFLSLPSRSSSSIQDAARPSSSHASPRPDSSSHPPGKAESEVGQQTTSVCKPADPLVPPPPPPHAPEPPVPPPPPPEITHNSRHKHPQAQPASKQPSKQPLKQPQPTAKPPPARPPPPAASKQLPSKQPSKQLPKQRTQPQTPHKLPMTPVAASNTPHTRLSSVELLNLSGELNSDRLLEGLYPSPPGAPGPDLVYRNSPSPQPSTRPTDARTSPPSDAVAKGKVGRQEELLGGPPRPPTPQSPDVKADMQPLSMPSSPRKEGGERAITNGLAVLGIPGLEHAPLLLSKPVLQAPKAQPKPAAAQEPSQAATVPLANGKAPARSPSPLHPPPAVDVLLRQSQLCLILDLDHTLVNSARFSEVDEATARLLEEAVQRQALQQPDQHLLYRLPHIGMWTKLRPGVRLFLQRATQFFQLWIHTNGNRTYAVAIARLLDPTGELFDGRIIAQGAEDGTSSMNQDKRLMQGLEELESCALVVDDTSTVWQHHKDSLLAVERYVFFPSSRIALNMSTESFLESGRDEHGERGMLMLALDVLMRVHMRVFRQLREPTVRASMQGLVPWDARAALAAERSKVLQGVVILFSSIIPLGAKPQEHPAWIMAERFGARCTNEKHDGVTHLVAKYDGTEKVHWARHLGKQVVSKGWLDCSCVLWQRASEDSFRPPKPLPSAA